MSTFRDYLQQHYPEVMQEHFRPMDAQVIHMYHHLPSISEVRHRAGISYGQLYRILQRNGIKPYRREKPTRSLVHHYHREGLSAGDIASLTDYTERNVRNILRDS